MSGKLIFNHLKLICCTQVSQYQEFSIPYEANEYRIRAPFPAGENIADNGGTKAVYRVYQQLPAEEKQCVPSANFTSDQLFWVSANSCKSNPVSEKNNNIVVNFDQKQKLFKPIPSWVTPSTGAPTKGPTRTSQATTPCSGRAR